MDAQREPEAPAGPIPSAAASYEFPMYEPGPREGSRLRALTTSQAARVTALAVALLGCAVTVAFLLGDTIGARGLLVGALLALVPAPVVVSAIVWLGRVRPLPVKSLVFAFAWGSCAGALVALLANSWSFDRLTDLKGEEDAEILGLTVVAPVIEELVKGLAVLLLFVTIRSRFAGVLDGLVPAAVSAAGFAFTENILYFGREFAASDDRVDGGTTWHTFIARGIVSPFAHPLFTSMIGLGFGLAVLARSRHAAILYPIGGYVLAVGLHAAWNGSAVQGPVFLGVYFLVMMPILGAVVWFAVIVRRDQLRAVEDELPQYVGAGWFRPHEPLLLSSMGDRSRALRTTKALWGSEGTARMRAYQADATLLAELRRRARESKGDADPRFAGRERALLDRIWAAKPGLARVVDHTMPSPRWRYVKPPVPGWMPPNGRAPFGAPPPGWGMPGAAPLRAPHPGWAPAGPAPYGPPPGWAPPGAWGPAPGWAPPGVPAPAPAAVWGPAPSGPPRRAANGRHADAAAAPWGPPPTRAGVPAQSPPPRPDRPPVPRPESAAAPETATPEAAASETTAHQARES